MKQEAYVVPTREEIGEIFLEHVSRLADLLASEKFAILQARKFAKYYARGMANRMEFSAAVNQCHDLANLQILCSRFFVPSEN